MPTLRYHPAIIAQAAATIAVLMPGRFILGLELLLPRHFEQVTQDMGPEMMTSAGQITCGPSAENHLKAIRKYVEAGFDHVYIHQIGPQQREFMEFARAELLPELRGLKSRDGDQAAMQ